MRQVGEAVERSGPVHRLGAKLSEIQAGLRSVQKRLEQRSPTVTQAKITQKVSRDVEDRHHSEICLLQIKHSNETKSCCEFFYSV